MNQKEFKLIFDCIQYDTINYYDNPNFGQKPYLSLNLPEFSVFMQAYLEFWSKITNQ